jgi:hypothetical protein
VVAVSLIRRLADAYRSLGAPAAVA